MCFGGDIVSDEFAYCLLQLGAGQGLDAESQIDLSEYIRCTNNTTQGLIHVLYEAVLDPRQAKALQDDYFLDCTILSTKNIEVDEINSAVLSAFLGKAIVHTSSDSVIEREYDYVPPKFFHTLNPFGFPLHKIVLKKGVPLTLLRNLNSHQGLYNETHMILV